jgi:TPR repeat protein
MKPKFLILVLVLAAGVAGLGYWLTQKTATYNPPAEMAADPKTNVVDIAAVRAQADAGDPAAETILGRAYLNGHGVKASMKDAAKYFQLAADKNYPDALAALGELTQAGQGVPANLDQAVQLYRRAAEAGSVAGQYNLAFLYEQGTGVKQDEHEAAKWYEKAAEGGDPIAQYDIGQRYDLGVGVATNRVQACKWLTLAAAQGQADSSNLLPNVKREMSSDELAEAVKLVSEFKPRAPK